MAVTPLIEHVLRLDVALQAASARLQARSDDEALHDLRVGVRRLRSLLRPLRNLSDVNTLEAAATALGHLSTPLRDSEVLVQELEARAQSALGDWHDRLQWLRRAEQESDLQPLCDSWRQALAAAEQRSAEALKPLCRQFS